MPRYEPTTRRSRSWHMTWCLVLVGCEGTSRQRGIASSAPSLKGMGERFDEAERRRRHHIGDVVDAVRAADTPCVLVGHSYGSIPVWGAAAAIPDCLAAVINLDGFLARTGACAFDVVPPIRRVFD